MASVNCLFCSYTGRIDNVNQHIGKNHHNEMMANVNEEMARYVINHKTPVVWKREGNKLAFAYCLTCKKASINDANGFKTKHTEAICKGGWATYKDLFLSKVPVGEETEEVRNEIVESAEADLAYSPHIKAILGKDFEGTTEDGFVSIQAQIKKYETKNKELRDTNDTLQRQNGLQKADIEKLKDGIQFRDDIHMKYILQIEQMKRESGVFEAQEEIKAINKILLEKEHEISRLEKRCGELGDQSKELGELTKQVEALKKENGKLKIRLIKVGDDMKD